MDREARVLVPHAGTADARKEKTTGRSGSCESWKLNAGWMKQLEAGSVRGQSRGHKPVCRRAQVTAAPVRGEEPRRTEPWGVTPFKGKQRTQTRKEQNRETLKT